MSTFRFLVSKASHMKERNHDKAFYQLCQHMEPDYFQLEFDLRAYLCHLSATGQPLWPAAEVQRVSGLDVAC